jgi:hypothetical protein
MGTQRHLPPPVADLVDARHRQPGRIGELLAGDAVVEPLADQTAQLGVGVIEWLRPGGERSTKPAVTLGQARSVAPRLPLPDLIG